MRPGLLRSILLVASLPLAGCLRFVEPQVHPLPRFAVHDSVRVPGPARARLVDGTSVRYPTGFSLVRGTIRGPGVRYDLRLRETGSVEAMALDSILGMERYARGLDLGTSLLGNGLLLGGSFLLMVGSSSLFDRGVVGYRNASLPSAPVR